MRDRVLGVPRSLWLVLAIVLGVLAAVAALVPARGTPGIEVADLGETLATILHGVGYAALAGAAMLAQAPPRALATTIVLIGYGTALEVIQGVVGDRSAQWIDVGANAAGVVLGVLVASSLRRRQAA